MKKVWGWIIGVILVVAIGFYIISSNSSAAPVATANPSGGTPTTTSTPDAGTPPTTTPAAGTPTSTGSGSNTGTGTGASGYKDGTYTGSVADAVYGKLQVAVTISGGKITDITWPVYPNSPGHTSEVSASALPALKQEVIVSQSANVNVVSGATQDSQAFQESLAAALSQAKS